MLENIAITGIGLFGGAASTSILFGFAGADQEEGGPFEGTNVITGLLGYSAASLLFIGFILAGLTQSPPN
ncbi:MAG: hypothetical protein WBA39_15100 [Rivularia sp. (in: cyanobacteria)]